MAERRLRGRRARRAQRGPRARHRPRSTCVRLRRGEVPRRARASTCTASRPPRRAASSPAELEDACAAGVRCVLVIHGRGLHSESGPVLRDGVVELADGAAARGPGDGLRERAARATAAPAPATCCYGARGRVDILGRPMSSQLGTIFRITTFGESHGGGVGVRRGRLPAAARARGRGHPARPRPAPARPEPAHHAAPGSRPRRDPLGRVRGPDARQPDRAARAQRGRAARGLRGHEGRLPPLARRLHQRGEVRRPQLAGRRPRERARDDRPRRGRRRSRGSSSRAVANSRCSPGSGASTPSSRRSTRRA